MSNTETTKVDTPVQDKKTGMGVQELIAKLEGSSRLPDKLMKILLTNEAPDAIWWLPRGDTFIIQKDKFQGAILLKYFRGNKFKSLVRNMHRWGFKRMTSDAEPMGKTVAFSHSLFHKDDPELVLQVTMINDAKERKKEQEAKKKEAIKRAADEVLESSESSRVKKAPKREGSPDTSWTGATSATAITGATSATTLTGAAGASKSISSPPLAPDASKVLDITGSRHLLSPSASTALPGRPGPTPQLFENMPAQSYLSNMLDDQRRLSLLRLQQETELLGGGRGAYLYGNRTVADINALRSLALARSVTRDALGAQDESLLFPRASLFGGGAGGVSGGNARLTDMVLMSGGLGPGAGGILADRSIARSSFAQLGSRGFGLNEQLGGSLNSRQLELLELQSQAVQARSLCLGGSSAAARTPSQTDSGRLVNSATRPQYH
ncbi:HSF-type DNA-binding [Seminavis robusta]|uniref:HSF-type DNA-binding n=1 Tax=Seminavis robusta TaxID=568900 RepID=A0A9N8HSM3_9STRA|nr:HSF-type DNA-binding [Seminavis robusta]|eukprot:Sro1461_g274770.1 HSF-type DNA-binding (437) ;mRNA; r:13919-15356